MSSIFDDTTIYHAMNGDRARVTSIAGEVLIRAVDMGAAEATSIAMTPAQARELAAGIVAAAEKAEGKQ